MLVLGRRIKAVLKEMDPKRFPSLEKELQTIVASNKNKCSSCLGNVLKYKLFCLMQKDSSFKEYMLEAFNTKSFSIYCSAGKGKPKQLYSVSK